MSFRPKMTAAIQGLQARQPLQWRALDGIVADLWHAEGQAGGGGYYVSPDPRIVLLLEDEGDSLRLFDRADGFDRTARQMRILYIPAGRPIWSRLVQDSRFTHLDLHFDARALEHRLGRSLGPAALAEVLRRPVLREAAPEIEGIARLLADEVARPAHHDLYAEGLVQAVLGAILSPEEGASNGGLTPAQLRRLRQHMEANLHRRVPAAELAEVAGLSESWFAHAFKQATGETPLHWQIRLRIDRAQDNLRNPGLTLAEVAGLTGFADQAHLTRVFRAQTGHTPGAWRKAMIAR